MGNSQPDVDLRMTVSPQFYTALNKLASASGIAPGDLLSRAFALWELAFEADAQGKQVGIAEKGQTLDTVFTGFTDARGEAAADARDQPRQ